VGGKKGTKKGGRSPSKKGAGKGAEDAPTPKTPYGEAEPDEGDEAPRIKTLAFLREKFMGSEGAANALNMQGGVNYEMNMKGSNSTKTGGDFKPLKN